MISFKTVNSPTIVVISCIVISLKQRNEDKANNSAINLIKTCGARMLDFGIYSRVVLGSRPAPSSPSEVITMLKGMTKHEDKEHEKT